MAAAKTTLTRVDFSLVFSYSVNGRDDDHITLLLQEKVVQDRACVLTATQRDIYTAIVAKCALMKKQDAEDIKTPHIKAQKANGNQDDNKTYLSPLHTLIALRQLADHPMLVNNVLDKIGWSDTRVYDPASKSAKASCEAAAA